jgi:hypothetical protein
VFVFVFLLIGDSLDLLSFYAWCAVHVIAAMQTISVLLLKGKWAPIKAAACDAGLTFLQHLGYALRSGFWCLSADAAAAKSGVGSAQKTWLAARGALGRAMGDELYLLAESLAESK